MIIDFRRVDIPWFVNVVEDTEVYAITKFRPYFYIIAKSLTRDFTDTIYQILKDIIDRDNISAKLRRLGFKDDFIKEVTETNPVSYEETNYKPWIFDVASQRYVKVNTLNVYKVKLWIPKHVKLLAHSLISSRKCRCSAFNIVYLARVMFDFEWAKPLDIEPIYYDLDTEVLEKLSRLKYIVYDIEWIPEEKTYILSILETNLFKPMTLEEAKKNVQTFVFKEDEIDNVIEDIQSIFNNARVLVGFNNTGFDDRLLIRLGILTSQVYRTKSVIDLAVFLRRYAQASGIGLASFSLADVLTALHDKLGISLEMVITKLRSAEMLRNVNEAVKYNINDVLATWKLAEMFLPMIFGVAGLVQVPPDVVYRVRPGQLFEYSFVHWLEIHDEVIEARKVFQNEAERMLLKGEKVLTINEVLQIWEIYGKELQKIENPNQAKEFIRKVADRVLKEVIKKRALGKKQTTKVERVVTGKILHFDVEMMYPTKIINEQVDPCCYISGLAEDAVFNVKMFPAPFYSFVQRLYNARAWVKKMKKEAKTESEKAMFSLLSDLIKPILNSAYGALSKSKGFTHGAHLQVASKIFNDTIRDFIQLILYAKWKLGLPIYGDTDSLFILIPDNVDENQVINEITKFAKEVGYGLSFEGKYDLMYIYAKKSYLTIEFGKSCKVKGQILAKLKHLASPVIRTTVIDAIKRRSVKPIIELIENENNPILLIPSLARKVADMFLLDVETIKRTEPERLRNRIKVMLSLDPENKRISYLKSMSLNAVTHARFCAFALNYGEKLNNDTWFVNLKDVNPEDILDLRALPVIESFDKLSSRLAIVLTKDKMYMCRIKHTNDVKYILINLMKKNQESSREVEIEPGSIHIYLGLPITTGMRNRKNKYERIPINYTNLVRLKIISPAKLYLLAGVEIKMQVIKEVDLSELKFYVLDTLIKYMRFLGLNKVFTDFELLEKKKNEYANQEILIPS